MSTAGALADTTIEGFAAVDSAGNSFQRLDQNTEIRGQTIVGLNSNSVANQQSGPGFVGDGAVVVVAED
ncbi:hypothetical protein H4R18_004947 [Coemansia javaensis]|uniref:Uncharacterized protein n=1 Tax=Coemansia javaensis TaxID=2761396 RepID=A0A9W8HAR1_9FUNG|nr:hypothetical protein H4R18_004947 [Coemansia javaensis]